LQKLKEVAETSADAALSWRQRDPACGCLELASPSRPMRACPQSIWVP